MRAHKAEAATGFPTLDRNDVLVGWITFSGEFQLYANRTDVGKKYGRSCISGRFSTIRQLDSAARRFRGKRVRLTGTSLDANQYQNDNPYGSLVENYCASDTVFIASSIVAEPANP